MRHRVGKHFLCEVAEGRFAFRHDQGEIAREAALDGSCVGLPPPDPRAKSLAAGLAVSACGGDVRPARAKA